MGHRAAQWSLPPSAEKGGVGAVPVSGSVAAGQVAASKRVGELCVDGAGGLGAVGIMSSTLVGGSGVALWTVVLTNTDYTSVLVGLDWCCRLSGNFG